MTHDEQAPDEQAADEQAADEQAVSSAADVTAELPIVVVESPVVVESTAVVDVVPEELGADAVEPDPVAEPVIASHAAPRRRRRWPWVSAVVLLLVVAVVSAGGLWYVSGLVGAGARVDRDSTPFPLAISANETATGLSYSGPTGGWDDQGLMGIATVEGGYVQTDDPVVTDGNGSASGTRQVTDQVLPPAPLEGQAAALDGWYFPRDPMIGLGREYADVTYDSPLGATPAWVIPGTSSTWVIFTHGRGATPLEGLRIAEVTSGLGYPTMLIRYRNDAQAPAGNGYGQFGADEWEDLEGAVQYALDQGADRVVLAGASMGGAIVLSFLQNSALADRVPAAFLDAPAADFSQIVEIKASEMGLPGVVTSAGMQVAAWRYGFDWEATDYTAAASGFTTPMLIVQGTADETVPAAVNEDFAAAVGPEVVTLELFEGAGHVMAWNVDRPRYEELLTAFLDRFAAAS